MTIIEWLYASIYVVTFINSYSNTTYKLIFLIMHVMKGFDDPVYIVIRQSRQDI